MADRKNAAFRTLWIKKGDELKTIYAKAKKAFTAADLQRYTEVEGPGISGEELLARLVAINREVMAEKQKRKKKKA